MSNYLQFFLRTSKHIDNLTLLFNAIPIFINFHLVLKTCSNKYTICTKKKTKSQWVYKKIPNVRQLNFILMK